MIVFKRCLLYFVSRVKIYSYVVRTCTQYVNYVFNDVLNQTQFMQLTSRYIITSHNYSFCVLKILILIVRILYTIRLCLKFIKMHGGPRKLSHQVPKRTGPAAPESNTKTSIIYQIFFINLNIVCPTPLCFSRLDFLFI